MNMDNLPYPDFDDYFTAYDVSPIKKELQPSLVIETSRGCWWGEKYQCTFCGLNGSTMKYRSKTVDKVLRELQYLNMKYGRTRFQVVDNILDLNYIDKLFPKICDSGLKVELFYETKSNLSKKQLLLMKKGGVNEIQPGIESLSDIVLNIMKKGVSGLDNIQLLKWCREIDIIPYWNLIWGFPGEPPAAYYRMEEIVPLLVHLYPPSGFGKILLDRFSPYFMEPLQNGIVNVRPAVGYHYVYSLPDEHLCKIAYHFDFDYADGRVPSSYVKNFKENILQWKEMWNTERIPVLNMYHAEKLVMINDTRKCAVHDFHILSNETARIYDICDGVRSFQSILVAVKRDYPSLTENDVEESLYDLLDKKLMLCDKNRYLSLAVPLVQSDVA
jgi:ribosomal peptide maturation radical SAM protein 1